MSGTGTAGYCPTRSLYPVWHCTGTRIGCCYAMSGTDLGGSDTGVLDGEKQYKARDSPRSSSSSSSASAPPLSSLSPSGLFLSSSLPLSLSLSLPASFLSHAHPRAHATHTRTHIHALTYTHTHIHTHTHTSTHTSTHKLPPSLPPSTLFLSLPLLSPLIQALTLQNRGWMRRGGRERKRCADGMARMEAWIRRREGGREGEGKGGGRGRDGGRGRGRGGREEEEVWREWVRVMRGRRRGERARE
eukprot:1723633-Rhodomonas_salina.1